LAWIVLVLSGVMESVWATALGKSDGFSRPLPTTVFLVGLLLSMLGLGYAMRDIPVPTAYAVWVSIGVLGTVLYAAFFDGYTASVLKVALLAMLLGSVIGLKLAE
jgi:quaternary ammonium compound-resistance protein SugE